MARKRYIVTIVCDVQRHEDVDDVQYDLENLFLESTERNFEIDMIEEESYDYDDDDGEY